MLYFKHLASIVLLLGAVLATPINMGRDVSTTLSLGQSNSWAAVDAVERDASSTEQKNTWAAMDSVERDVSADQSNSCAAEDATE